MRYNFGTLTRPANISVWYAPRRRSIFSGGGGSGGGGWRVYRFPKCRRRRFRTFRRPERPRQMFVPSVASRNNDYTPIFGSDIAKTVTVTNRSVRRDGRVWFLDYRRRRTARLFRSRTDFIKPHDRNGSVLTAAAANLRQCFDHRRPCNRIPYYRSRRCAEYVA